MPSGSRFLLLLRLFFLLADGENHHRQGGVIRGGDPHVDPIPKQGVAVGGFHLGQDEMVMDDMMNGRNNVARQLHLLNWNKGLASFTLVALLCIPPPLM